MKVIETELAGCFVLEPALFYDSRGYFFESFNQQKFNELLNVAVTFVQDNQSKSTQGVLRGLHYQTGTYAQAKLIRVIQGAVLDVAVDLRPASKTFGAYITEELSEENQKQVFIPKGFAHGFLVLSETAIFSYKCDQYYCKEAEAGIRFDDPTLAIDWKQPFSNLIISDKDLALPSFEKAQPIW